VRYLLYEKNNELKLSDKKVIFTERGEQKEKYIGIEGEQWWNDLANKHEHINIVEIVEVNYTDKQLERFEKVKDIIGDTGELEDYIENGNINPENEKFKIIFLERENEELKSKVEANLTATRKMVRVDDLTPEELVELVDLYDGYKVDYAYSIGDVFKLDGKLYKIIQAHTSQSDWIPKELPALYLELMPENVIPIWVQPTGATDAPNTGDKRIYEGKVYESLIDANTTVPGGDEPYNRYWVVV